MKRYLFVLILILSSLSGQSQQIDSVTVGVYGRKGSSWNYWSNHQLIIDSLSGGKEINHLVKKYTNWNWTNVSLTNYSYSGLDSTITNYEWANNAWQPKTKQIITYSPPFWTLTFYCQWNNNAWDTITNEVRTYDANNRLMSIDLNQYHPFYLHYYQYSLYYDTINHITQNIGYTWNSIYSEFDSDHYLQLQYDSTGNLISKIEEDLEVMFSILSGSQNYYTYDSLNRVLTESVSYYDVPTDSWMPSSIIYDYSYYTNGDTLGIVTNDYYTAITYTTVSSQLFDTNQNLIYNHTETNNVTPSGSLFNLYRFHYPDDNQFLTVRADSAMPTCNSNPLTANIITIGGNQPIHYSWSPDSLVSNDTLAQPTVFATTDQLLYLTATDNSNQVIIDSVFLKATTAPQITSIASFGTSCIGCTNGYLVLAVDTGNYGISLTEEISSIGLLYQRFLSNDSILQLPSGDYSVCLYDLIGCSVCTTAIILDDPTFISSAHDESSMVIYPNPCTRSAKILNLSPGSHIEVFNSIGMLLQNTISYNDQCALDTSTLPKGSYLIRVNDQEKVSQAWVVVQ